VGGRSLTAARAPSPGVLPKRLLTARWPSWPEAPAGGQTCPDRLIGPAQARGEPEQVQMAPRCYLGATQRERYAANRPAIPASWMPRISAASRAALAAPSTATVATGMPVGICTVA
jgi:hypothetical protein